MPLAVDAKTLLHDLKNSSEPEKKNVSVYMDTALWEQFKEACGDLSPSLVVCRLMELFIADLKDGSRGRGK